MEVVCLVDGLGKNIYHRPGGAEVAIQTALPLNLGSMLFLEICVMPTLLSRHSQNLLYSSPVVEPNSKGSKEMVMKSCHNGEFVKRVEIAP